LSLPVNSTGGRAFFWRQGAIPNGHWLDVLQEVTELAGARMLKQRVTGNSVSQLFVSTQCTVAPSRLLRSAKRWLYQISQLHVLNAFQRNHCLHGIAAL
jgi:hypothetical protein